MKKTLLTTTAIILLSNLSLAAMSGSAADGRKIITDFNIGEDEEISDPSTTAYHTDYYKTFDAKIVETLDKKTKESLEFSKSFDSKALSHMDSIEKDHTTLRKRIETKLLPDYITNQLNIEKELSTLLKNSISRAEPTKERKDELDGIKSRIEDLPNIVKETEIVFGELLLSKLGGKDNKLSTENDIRSYVSNYVFASNLQ